MLDDKTIRLFVNRDIKAKDLFVIKEISYNEAYNFVKKYHYLGDKKFLGSFFVGLFDKEDDLLGVAVYGAVQGIVTLKGWFGLDNSRTDVYELHRLAMHPKLNGTNATSYLLGRSIRLIKKERKVSAIISLADSSLHFGYIYQACNFKYYGLTDKKTDFFTEDGRLNPRGKTSTVHGVWLPRTRKHRYALVFNKDLKVKYKEQPYPKGDKGIKLTCCEGTNVVYDKRFKVYYSCPRCTGKLTRLRDGEVGNNNE